MIVGPLKSDWFESNNRFRGNYPSGKIDLQELQVSLLLFPIRVGRELWFAARWSLETLSI